MSSETYIVKLFPQVLPPAPKYTGLPGTRLFPKQSQPYLFIYIYTCVCNEHCAGQNFFEKTCWHVKVQTIEIQKVSLHQLVDTDEYHRYNKKGQQHPNHPRRRNHCWWGNASENPAFQGKSADAQSVGHRADIRRPDLWCLNMFQGSNAIPPKKTRSRKRTRERRPQGQRAQQHSWRSIKTKGLSGRQTCENENWLAHMDSNSGRYKGTTKANLPSTNLQDL